MRIWTQKSASIQKRTSPLKFDNFAEKSEKDTVSYLSTKLPALAELLAVAEDGLLLLRRGEDVVAEALVVRPQVRDTLILCIT